MVSTSAIKSLKWVKRTCGNAFVVAAADVKDETAIVFEDAEDLARKRQEPLYILLFGLVSVCFFEVQRIGRGGHY